MSRHPANSRGDRRAFSNTAKRTRLINVKPRLMRGGIRL